MKKVFGALAATFGFFGLAALIIFSVESASVANYETPSGNLTADIAANNPAVDGAPVPQLADVGANVNTNGSAADSEAASSATSAVAATSSSSVPDLSAQVAPPTPILVSPTAPARLPSVPPPPPPVALAPTYAANLPSTSTDATATITVTPTAPTPPLVLTPPPSSQVSIAQTPPSPGGFTLPYSESDFAADQNWQATWGVVASTYSGAMDLSAGPASTGGAAVLKNSAGWANYKMSATVDWVAGQTIGVMADYDDASNYVGCEYTKTNSGGVTMQLVQYANGHEIFLSPPADVSSGAGGVGLDLPNLDLSIAVDGLYGACYFNGQSISNEGIGPGMSAMSSAGSGGIGFAVSDPTPNVSEIVVKQVNVVGE